MTKSTLLIGTLAAVLSVGCEKSPDPEKVELSTNPKISVATLFTHDGCTVYRFEDNLKDHYFARCDDGVETISPKTVFRPSTRDENISSSGQ